MGILDISKFTGYIQGVLIMKSPTDLQPGTEPKYIWFASHLRSQIVEGQLKPGDRLPSRNEIRELHQITQPTIERAQAILEREGLIVRRERQGVFVADPPVVRKSTDNQVKGAARLASGTIGILTPGEGEIRPGHRQQGWSDYITQGALAACREQGKHALLLNPARLQGEELEHLLEHPPLGFVFASLTSSVDFGDLQNVLKALQDDQQPFVVYGADTAFENFDRVVCDHEKGCYELTRWLIGRGCERILPFWPPIEPGQNWLEERLAGYHRAMKEAGLKPMPVREVPMRHLPSDPDDTWEKFDATTRHKAGYLADYLGHKRGCDAILEVTDGEISTTAAACRMLGYIPNQDLLIAGYDNYWNDITERNFEPTIPIATVDKHNFQTGRELVELLVARVTGQLGDGAHKRLIEPELVALDTNIPAQNALPNGVVAKLATPA
jgi:DNA-binding LacI/PurR family transcriptional regulator